MRKGAVPFQRSVSWYSVALCDASVADLFPGPIWTPDKTPRGRAHEKQEQATWIWADVTSTSSQMMSNEHGTHWSIAICRSLMSIASSYLKKSRMASKIPIPFTWFYMCVCARVSVFFLCAARIVLERSSLCSRVFVCIYGCVGGWVLCVSFCFLSLSLSLSLSRFLCAYSVQYSFFIWCLLSTCAFK